MTDDIPASKRQLKTRLTAMYGKDALTVKVKHAATPHTSKAKGRSWELDFCKQLSVWCDGQKDTFLPRSGSGARPDDISGESGFGGDVHMNRASGEALVEAVHWELKNIGDPVTLLTGFMGWNKEMVGYWEQCQLGALSSKREPMLGLKLFLRPPLVILRVETYFKLRVAGKVQARLVGRLGQTRVALIEMADLLTSFSVDSLLVALEKR